jgi:hypothetical protein
MDWITLAQGRERWRVLVNAIMNHWVLYNLLVIQEVLCSMELGGWLVCWLAI